MVTGYRIHISPIGYDNERVWRPLLDPKADKVYLITKKGEDHAKKYVEGVIQSLNEHKIPFVEKKCSIDDLAEVLGLYRKIFQAEAGNSILVNVSTGSKIMAIAGMMACMMWNGEPYYVVPDRYEGEQIAHGMKEKKPLPHYRIDKPPEAIVELTMFLDEKGAAGASKKSIIRRLKSKGFLTIIPQEREPDEEVHLNAKKGKKREGPSPQAEYKALEERVLRPAREEWKFTREVGKGKSQRIFITEEGKTAVLVFGDKTTNHE